MKKLTLISVSFINYFLSIYAINAQEIRDTKITNTSNDSAQIVVITLNEGGAIKGIIVSKNSEEIKVNTDFAGIISLKRYNIVSIVEYNEQPVYQNRNNKNSNNLNIVKFGGSSNNSQKGNFVSYKASHKYYANNNYIGLKKKELVYQNIWLLYNDWDYGINDNFSAGGGFVFLGTLTTLNLHIRTQIELNEKLKIGGGYTIFIIPGNTGYYNFSITSGGFTIGNEKCNATFSLGQGNITSSHTSDKPSNSFNNIIYAIGGSYKLSESTSLITDNFYMEKSNMKFYSIGFRFHGKNTVFDFGYMGNTYLKETYDYNYNPNTGGYTNSKQYASASLAYPFLAITYKVR